MSDNYGPTMSILGLELPPPPPQATGSKVSAVATKLGLWSEVNRVMRGTLEYFLCRNPYRSFTSINGV